MFGPEFRSCVVLSRERDDISMLGNTFCNGGGFEKRARTDGAMKEKPLVYSGANTAMGRTSGYCAVVGARRTIIVLRAVEPAFERSSFSSAYLVQIAAYGPPSGGGS